MFRPLSSYGLLYADPHPGNYRFLGGGRVAFLDFGCTKKLPADLVAGMKRYVIAAQDGDEEEFDRACVEVLGLRRERDEESWKLYVEYTKMSSSRSRPTPPSATRSSARARRSRSWYAGGRRS